MKTLDSISKEIIKKQQESIKDVCESIGRDFSNNSHYPEIQVDVFRNYFSNPFKDLITKGRDTYNENDKTKSLPELWRFTVGNLNTPVNVVDGEGPERNLVATLPPFLNDINAGNKKGEIEVNRLSNELNTQNKNNPLSSGETKVKLYKELNKVATVSKEIKENHAKNWLNAIDKVEKYNSKETKSESKNKNKTQSEDDIEFQW